MSLSASNKSKEAEMDQFMDDFLNCRIDFDAPPTPTPTGRRRSSNSHRRKSHASVKVDATGLLRRANTVDNPRIKSSGAKSKTKGGDLHHHGSRRQSCPAVQPPPNHQSHNRKHQQQPSNQETAAAAAMDPHKIISMLEKYADLDDGDQAEAFLHYGMQKPSSSAGSKSSSAGKKTTKKKGGLLSSQNQSRAK